VTLWVANERGVEPAQGQLQVFDSAVLAEAAPGHVLQRAVNGETGTLPGARHQRLGFQLGQCLASAR